MRFEVRHDQPERRVQRGGSSCVLLALTDDGDHPIGTLRQGVALADALGAKLHVLQVLSRGRRLIPFGAHVTSAEASRRVERSLAAFDRTKAWCDEVLREPLSTERLRIRIGPFIDEVALHADGLDAALVVIAPSTRRLGATATALAGVSRRPVLVSRHSPSQTPLLAATDLQDADYWVLQKAAQLGEQLGAPVVAIHNVSGWSMTYGGIASPVFPTPPPILGALDRQEARLREATAQLRSRAPMSTVLASDLDTVDAILEQADVHDARAIVVGTRPRAWLERFVKGSIAAEVVNRSTRSVVVTPCPHVDHQSFA